MLNKASLNNNEFKNISSGFSVLNPIKMPSAVLTNATNTSHINAANGTNNQQGDVVQLTKNKKPLGKIVLGSMVAVGIVVLALTKGLSGSTASKIRRWADKWEDNFLRYACKNKTMDKLDEKLVETSQTVNKMFKLSDSIANFTAIKDTLFHEFTSWGFLNNKSNKPILKYLKFPKLQKFLNKWIPLQKLCDFFTKNVLKISVGAVDSKYAKVSSSLEKLEVNLKETLKDASLTPQKREKIEKLIELISPTYKKGFGKYTRNIRLSNIHKSLATLAEKVKEHLCNPFYKKDKHFSKVYSSYVTKTLSSNAQNAHKSAISSAKVSFSNDISDVYATLRSTANELKHCLAPKDKQSRLIFGEILENLESYKAVSGSKEAKLRKGLQQEIVNALDKIILIQKEGGIAQTTENLAKMTKLISTMKKTMGNSSKKGLLQNILSEMKGVIPEAQYKKLKLQTKSVNDLLNEAIDKEGNNLFDKIAESKVGSIPTDMVGLGMMAGTGAWAISRGKDKDEKIGATLKVGIPLLGGIASYFYTASKAFSGVKNLAFGALTAYLLNKAGTGVFNYYQKRYVENKSVKEIAKDAYNDAVSA